MNFTKTISIGGISQSIEKRGGFLPNSLAGNILWLDASDDATMYDAVSNGSRVAAGGYPLRWEDKSGAGNHATTVATANAYQRVDKVKNDRAILRSTGSDKYYRSNATLNGLDGVSIFYVVTSATGSGYRSLLRWQDGGPYFVCGYSTDGRVISSIEGATTGIQTGVAVGAWQVVCTQRNTSGTFDAYKNGTLVGTRAAHTANIGTVGLLTIGRYNPSPSEWFAGDVAEVIVYNRRLDATERGKVTDYLKDKWAIA